MFKLDFDPEYSRREFFGRSGSAILIFILTIAVLYILYIGQTLSTNQFMLMVATLLTCTLIICWFYAKHARISKQLILEGDQLRLVNVAYFEGEAIFNCKEIWGIREVDRGKFKILRVDFRDKGVRFFFSNQFNDPNALNLLKEELNKFQKVEKPKLSFSFIGILVSIVLLLILFLLQ